MGAQLDMLDRNRLICIISIRDKCGNRPTLHTATLTSVPQCFANPIPNLASADPNMPSYAVAVGVTTDADLRPRALTLMHARLDLTQSCTVAADMQSLCICGDVMCCTVMQCVETGTLIAEIPSVRF